MMSFPFFSSGSQSTKWKDEKIRVEKKFSPSRLADLTKKDELELEEIKSILLLSATKIPKSNFWDSNAMAQFADLQSVRFSELASGRNPNSEESPLWSGVRLKVRRNGELKQAAFWLCH